MVIGLQFSSTKIFLFFLYLWVFFIPFSHAPSYMHPLITFPGIASLALISIFFTSLSNLRRFIFKDYFFYFIVFALLITNIMNLFVASRWNEKYLNYLMAHTWFFLLLYIVYATPKIYNINIKFINKLIIATLSISIIYSLFESFLHLLNIDLGSYIPRYDRQEYKFWTPFIFFRTRAFNYESANLAMMLNIFFIIIYYLNSEYFKKRILKNIFFFFIWIVALLLTFSAVQLVLFFLFLIILFIKHSLHKPHFIIILIPAFAIILTNDVVIELFQYIIHHASGSESSQIRFKLFLNAINLIELSPIFGHGYAGFLNFMNSGFNNFYIQLFVQHGLSSILFYLIFLYLFVRTVLTQNIYLIFAVIFAFVHLFFIGDFWIPQVLLPILFVEYHLKSERES